MIITLRLRAAIAALFVSLSLTACITDVKGAQCGFLDAFVDSEGQQYCPDEAAPEDCEALNDAIVDAAVLCGGGAFTEEELRAELGDSGALQTCDQAVATSTDYDDCVDILSDEQNPPCEGTSLAPPPDVCIGAVLTAPSA